MRAVDLNKRLLTVEEYHKMGEVGILNPNDRVELIQGEIITMSPLKSLHTSCMKRLTAWMYRFIGPQATISVQDPITLGEYSEPEPDLALLTYSSDFYASRHPHANEVLLLIEISDSTLEIDRQIKKPLYAEAGIQEYWIINLQDKVIEVYQSPKGNDYQSKKVYKKGETVTIDEFGAQMKVSDIIV